VGTVDVVSTPDEYELFMNEWHLLKASGGCPEDRRHRRGVAL
jgi:hypothetical protein